MNAPDYNGGARAKTTAPMASVLDTDWKIEAETRELGADVHLGASPRPRVLIYANVSEAVAVDYTVGSVVGS